MSEGRAQGYATFISPGYRIGHENREAVRAYFSDHIGSTQKECAKALGIGVMAVGRHIRALRLEWQDKDDLT